MAHLEPVSMNAFHEHLAEQARVALRSGVAVIVDREAAFEDFIAELSGSVAWDDTHPNVFGIKLGEARARLVRFDGSWFAVRTAVEPFLGDDHAPDPPLLVYVPAEPPQERHDVLLELSRAGTRLDWEFDKEARNCLLKRFTDGAIDEVLAGGHATYADVLAFLEQHSGGRPSMLKALYPGVGSTEILARWAVDEGTDAAIDAKDARAELYKLLASRVGLTVPPDLSLAQARGRVARFLLVAEFRTDLAGAEPSVLGQVPRAETAIHRDEALTILRKIRATHPVAYVARADQVEQELHLAHAKIEADRLGRVDTFRFEERALLGWCADLLRQQDYGRALTVVTERAPSFWVEREVERKAQWEVARLTAELGLQVMRVAAESNLDLDATGWVRAYAGEIEAADRKGAARRIGNWFSMDQAQRQLEAFRVQMDDDPTCERGIAVTLREYERALHDLSERFVKALRKAGWVVPGVLQQSQIYPEVVRARAGAVAYLFIDAMRFEMGAELARLLSGAEDLQLQPAICMLPSITPIGMAALLPGASADFAVVEHKGKLAARLDGKVLPDLAARKKYLEATVADSVDLTLNDALTKKPSELAKRVQGASLVVVRSTEIDRSGETWDDSMARHVMATVLGNIARAVRRLSRAGIENFVIAADHGHQYGLAKSDDMKTESPGGKKTELHRRCWAGHGGQTPPGTVRVTSSDLGYASDLEFVFPTSTAVFPAGGDLSFHHGGPSLQELVIPVLSFRFRSKAEPPAGQGPKVRLTDVPTAVTNRMFAVTIEVEPGLFGADIVPMRVVLLSDQEEVGRAGMASGAEFDRSTGILRVRPGAPAQVGIMLTNDAKTSLRVLVLDPDSSAVLEESKSIPVQLMR